MFEDISSQLCRLCLKSGACPIDIYDPKRTNGFLVWEIIEELTEIKIYISDGLPPNICENCMQKLTDFKYFKKMCIDSRLEYLFRRINNVLVVPMTEDETRPLRHDLCGQGDVHTRDTWNNLEAEGIESEMHVGHEEVAKEMHPLVEYTSTIDGEIYVEEMQSSGVRGSASEVSINEPELLAQGDPCLHLSSRSSDEGSDVEECALNVTGPVAEIQVKNQNEQEIPPADEYLFTSAEISSYEGVQYLDAHVSMSQQVPLTEELTDQDDLHLYLSSDSSDETSDAEDRSANITGPETEVTNLTSGDVIKETVFGDGESMGNRKKTPEGKKDLIGLKDPERRFSARLRHGAKVTEATISLWKEQRLDSPSWNEEIVSKERLVSTSSPRSSKGICKTNVISGVRTVREEEEAINAGSILSGPLSRDVVDRTGQGLRCDKCGKKFKCKSLIIKHVKTHCGTDFLQFSDGGMKSKVGNALQRHKAVSFELNASKKKKQSGVSVEVNGEIEDQAKMKRTLLHTCQICHKEFAQKMYLRLHIKSVHLKESHFSCDICRRAFDCKQTLKIHIMSHSGEKSYLCSYCEKGFSLSCNLKRHIMSVHKQKKCHTCVICSKTFYKKCNLQSHLLTHTGERPFPCSVCSQTFTRRSHIKSHMLKHTGERPFACSICSKTFAQKTTLNNHILTHTGERPFACSICSKTFTQRTTLNKHILTHTGERPFACSICSKTFTQSSHIKSHMVKHTGEKPFACSICSKTFTCRTSLNTHQLAHTGERPFACSICAKTFTCRTSLNTHQLAHTGERPFACSICSKTFTWRKNLNSHQLAHTGERPFACSVCSKTFTQKTTLNSHILTHTGERPFACSICSKTFTQKTTLNSHILTHTGERPFACSICSKTFTQRSHVKSHMVKHTGERPFACSICSKTFTWRKSLNSHKLTHTGERPFSCSICSKTFTWRKSLNSHKLTHTGERPFCCSICSKTFTRKTTLNDHILTHTGERPFSCSICSKSFTRRIFLNSHMLMHAE